MAEGKIEPASVLLQIDVVILAVVLSITHMKSEIAQEIMVDMILRNHHRTIVVIGVLLQAFACTDWNAAEKSLHWF